MDPQGLDDIKALKIFGADERVQVSPCTSPPYKWICFLEMKASDGSKYTGTGFKIRVPGISRMLILTSGHCVYSKISKSYFQSITVHIPECNPMVATSVDLYAPDDYKSKDDPGSDYGVISLPGNSEDGFGWSAAISDGDINSRIVTLCGYPGDKTIGTMWVTGGQIEEVKSNEIIYKIDTIAGQSGSPIYTWYKGYWTVIGLHSKGKNSGPRFNSTMIYEILKGSNTINTYNVKSVRFPHAYLRLDGAGFKSPNGAGGGQVNCQYSPPGHYEKFYIYPMEVSPSLAQQPHPTIYVIRSARWNAGLRMDGTGMKKWNGSGGGTVNCQYASAISLWEHFTFWKHGNPENITNIDSGDIYSVCSVYFNKCYLRMDGAEVTKREHHGSGIVNCQYYNSPSNVDNGGYEQFMLIKV